jgi:histone deacetylase 1/2
MRKAYFGKADVGGAYLNALLGRNDEIYMEIRKEITDILVEALPELKEYVTEDGKLIVRIVKALYGLLQSAALWFEMFSSFLQSLGFVLNDIDKCVMNKKVRDHMITIILYVDDILIISPVKDDIKWLIVELEKEYGEVSVELSNKFTYLGMGVKVKKGPFFANIHDKVY